MRLSGPRRISRVTRRSSLLGLGLLATGALIITLFVGTIQKDKQVVSIPASSTTQTPNELCANWHQTPVKWFNDLINKLCTLPPQSNQPLPPNPSKAVVVPADFAYAVRSSTGCPVSVAVTDDVTSRLNTLLTTIPDGATVELAPSACYRLDQTLFIRDRRNLTMNGNGATFKRISSTPQAMLYPKSNPHFAVQNGSGLTLQDFRIEGLNTVNVSHPWALDPSGFGSGFGNKAFESGIILTGTSRITITNVKIDAVFGDGITVGSERAPTCTSDVTIGSVSIDRNGRQGIAVVCATGVVIDRVEVLHSHGAAIDLEPNGADAHVQHVEISNSYFNARIINIASYGTFDISDVSVHDNTLGGWSPAYPWLCVCGPSSSHRHDWSVQNNKTLRGASNRSTVVFSNVKNVRFSGNTSNSLGREPAASVELTNVVGAIQITDNTLRGAPATYSADSATGAVRACGNRLSGQQGGSHC